MITTTRRPKSYGIVRVSTDKQDKSPDMQAEDIGRMAATIDAEYMGCIAPDVGVSATHVRFFHRPAIIELRNRLKPGDYLIAWRYDRLARSMEDSVDLRGLLKAKKVKLHLVQQCEGELDFTSENGRMQALFYAMSSEMESITLSSRMKGNIGYRRAKGEAYHRNCRYGYKRTKIKTPNSKRSSTYWVWHQPEWDQMHEIYVRHKRGETFTSIMRDFKYRRLKTADGEPWDRNGKAVRFSMAFDYFVSALKEGKILIINNRVVEAFPNAKELVEEVRKKTAGAEENNNGSRVLARV